MPKSTHSRRASRPTRVLPQRQVRTSDKALPSRPANPQVIPDTPVPLLNNRFYRELLIHSGHSHTCAAHYEDPEQSYYQKLLESLAQLSQSTAQSSTETGSNSSTRPLPQYETWSITTNGSPESGASSAPMTLRSTRARLRLLPQRLTSYSSGRGSKRTKPEDVRDNVYEHIHRRYELVEKKSRNRDLELAAHALYRAQVDRERKHHLLLNHVQPVGNHRSSSPAWPNSKPPLSPSGADAKQEQKSPDSSPVRVLRSRAILPQDLDLRQSEFKLPPSWLKRHKRSW
ncbi:hypothetical protein IWQ62_005172 [Dispira parvispora]|uniref:Uncharacterized protein n=1 Tax=Dispira parvispora TaxID=1520584 RepID=A0A9W8ARH6_9FUNG|nr:hypothetical protein IWQ62_005172 [Dispira parvispora]